MKKYLVLLLLLMATSANAQFQYNQQGRIILDGTFQPDSLFVVEHVEFVYMNPDTFDLMYWDGAKWTNLARGNFNEVLKVDSTGALGWGADISLESDSVDVNADWNTMVNIPAGFADDTDNEGVTVEVDPVFTAHLAYSITASDTAWWGNNSAAISDSLFAYYDSLQVISVLADSLSAYFDSLRVITVISDSLAAYYDTLQVQNLIAAELGAYWDSTQVLSAIADSVQPETDPIFTNHLAFTIDVGDTTWWGSQSAAINDTLLAYYDSLQVITVIADSLLAYLDSLEVQILVSDSLGAYFDSTTTLARISDSLAAQGSGLPNGTSGDILRYDADWEALSAGSDGQVLKLSGGLPEWGIDTYGIVESDGGFTYQALSLSGTDTLRVGQDSTVVIINATVNNRTLYLSSEGAAAGNFFRVVVDNGSNFGNGSVQVYENDDASPGLLNIIPNGNTADFIFNGSDWVQISPGTSRPLSIGYRAQATGLSGVAIGTTAYTGGSYAIAIGNGSDGNTYDNGVAIGYNTEIGATYGIAIGYNSGTNSGIAIGRQAGGTGGVSIGYQATSFASTSIAIGQQAEIQTSGGSNAVSLGYQSNYNVDAGQNSTALGGATNATELGATALGYSNKAVNTFATALGYGSRTERYGEIWASAGSDQTTSGIGNKSGNGTITWYDQATAGVVDTLYLDGTPNSESFNIKANSTVVMDVQVLGWDANANERAVYTFQLVVTNDAGTTTLDVENKTVLTEDDAAWDFDFQIDDTNDTLLPVATGDGANTTYWTVTGRYSEIRE